MLESAIIYKHPQFIKLKSTIECQPHSSELNRLAAVDGKKREKLPILPMTTDMVIK